jgi:hypothetical protein
VCRGLDRHICAVATGLATELDSLEFTKLRKSQVTDPRSFNKATSSSVIPRISVSTSRLWSPWWAWLERVPARVRQVSNRRSGESDRPRRRVADVNQRPSCCCPVRRGRLVTVQRAPAAILNRPMVASKSSKDRKPCGRSWSTPGMAAGFTRRLSCVAKRSSARTLPRPWPCTTRER